MTDQPFTPTEELVRNAVRPSYSGPEFDRFIAQVKAEALREAAFEDSTNLITIAGWEVEAVETDDLRDRATEHETGDQR